MVKKIILILLGLLGLIVGVPLALAGGGILAVAGRDGAIQSGWHQTDTPTPALVADASNLGNSNVEVRGTAVSIVVEARNSSKPVFIGVGRAQDVENYLRGVANDEITKISFNPYRVETVREAGSLASAAPPGSQPFWVAQSSGTAPAMTWKVTDDGNYRAVVMNADGSAGVSTELAMGLKAPAIWGLGLGLLIAGLILSLIGLALLIWGIAAKRRKPLPPATAPFASAPVAAAPVATTPVTYQPPGAEPQSYQDARAQDYQVPPSGQERPPGG